ncbi:MAG TPA: phosphatase PAP2 family protein [Actinomycetaceae bacterium]|nr:phosphatase PAP2 family protein [Actinomycetaceae bacterium]
MNSRRPNHPAVWGLALAFVVALLVLAYVGFVRTITGQTIDEQLLVAARGFLDAEVARDGALGFLRYLPEVSAAVAASGLVAASIVRRSISAPVVALVSALAAATTTQILKSVLPRPNLGISEATMNSFPSGHTSVAAAAMLAIVLVASPRWRPVAATLGGAFASLAAAATYILGWHRPADVIGAVLVAGAWGLIGGWIILAREPKWNTWHRGTRGAPSGVWLGLPWIPAIVGLGTAVLTWWLLLREPTRPFDELVGWYILAGLGLVIGATMAVFGAASGLLTRETRAAD